MSLRELGIYALPNGRELVFAANGEIRALFNLELPLRVGSPQYHLNEHGRLVSETGLTAWDVTNLQDTGKTAETE